MNIGNSPGPSMRSQNRRERKRELELLAEYKDACELACEHESIRSLLRYTLFSTGGLDSNTFNPDPYQHAHNSGRQANAQELMDLIKLSSPALAQLLRKDQDYDDRKLAEQFDALLADDVEES